MATFTWQSNKVILFYFTPIPQILGGSCWGVEPELWIPDLLFFTFHHVSSCPIFNCANKILYARTVTLCARWFLLSNLQRTDVGTSLGASPWKPSSQTLCYLHPWAFICGDDCVTTGRVSSIERRLSDLPQYEIIHVFLSITRWFCHGFCLDSGILCMTVPPVMYEP